MNVGDLVIVEHPYSHQFLGVDHFQKRNNVFHKPIVGLFMCTIKNELSKCWKVSYRLFLDNRFIDFNENEVLLRKV